MHLPPFASNPIEPELPLPLAPSLGALWQAVAAAAAAVAALANEADPSAQDLAKALGDVAPLRQAATARAIEDVCAMMRAGLSALVAVRASGRDARDAARALLREFTAAQAAVRAVAGVEA